jgi:hypothetical protein
VGAESNKVSMWSYELESIDLWQPRHTKVRCPHLQKIDTFNVTLRCKDCTAPWRRLRDATRVLSVEGSSIIAFVTGMLDGLGSCCV